jgi:hypothetical protein
MRKIEFDLDGAKAKAIMLDAAVPKSCEAIWNRLPLTGMAIHAKFAAREFMLHLGGKNRIILEPEEPRGTESVAGLLDRVPFGVGRISYVYRQPGVLRGVQRDYSPEFQRELCEFAIYYGHSAPSLQDPGRQPDPTKSVNIWFATFEEPIPKDLIAKADALNYEGLKPLEIRKA